MVMGGAEKALLNLLEHLDYSRYDVTLWLKDRTGELLSQVNPGICVRCWGEHLDEKYRSFALKLLKQGKVWEFLYSFFFGARSKAFTKNPQRAKYYQLRSRLVRSGERYDAAILFQALNIQYLPCFLALMKTSNRIAWLHGTFAVPPSKEDVGRFRSYYGQFDHIVCVSEGVKAIHAGYYPELVDRMTVIYNLQDIRQVFDSAREAITEQFDGITLVTVGRLSREKGQDMIPAIAAELRSSGCQFKWYVVGDGPTRPTVETKIRDMKLDDYVFLIGTKQNPYPYISGCTLYVQPSYQEGFCVTTFEAKILQKRIVVTDVPGMREQFTEQMAFFAEPTVPSLVDAIQRALAAPEENIVHEPVTEEFNRRELEKINKLLG